MADRIYAGFDLSALGSDLAPDRVVTAANLAHDGLAFPDFYGEDMLLPEGKPPAYWLVLRRDYATQSGDTAALEPDNANGWYDREKEDLHLVVPTQSPQEVAAGAAAMLGKSRIGMKRLFLHPCFTVGYGSKDHCTMPYYGLVAAVYGDGRPVRLAN